MIFAIIFVVAFLFGFTCYAFTRQWMVAVSIPTALFVASTFTGDSVAGAQVFTLTFGVPLVFFAALLGAYVFQIRNQPPAESSDEIDQSEL